MIINVLFFFFNGLLWMFSVLCGILIDDVYGF